MSLFLQAFRFPQSNTHVNLTQDTCFVTKAEGNAAKSSAPFPTNFSCKAAGLAMSCSVTRAFQQNPALQLISNKHNAHCHALITPEQQ